MKWTITIVRREDNAVLFGGSTADPDELEAVAAEARRLRPDALIYLRSPVGQVVEFEGSVGLPVTRIRR